MMLLRIADPKEGDRVLMKDGTERTVERLMTDSKGPHFYEGYDAFDVDDIAEVIGENK